ncbi:hypothetical protein ATE92_0694 [Ulvibacter sp. MAR_2010_11]|nr:hypothetical protein ATE92_0694 [Ulvibacter sp. MAR_2010_11]
MKPVSEDFFFPSFLGNENYLMTFLSYIDAII